MEWEIAITRVTWYTIKAKDYNDAYEKFCEGALDTVKADDEETTNFEAFEKKEVEPTADCAECGLSLTRAVFKDHECKEAK
jgi:hypothetical protein